MVNKCAAIHCKSGYDCKVKNVDLSFHSFPLHSNKLTMEWLKRLPRKDFKPSKYSRLCSLHFKPEDFALDSSDIKQRRKRKRDDVKLLKRRLKPDAVPCVFDNLPVYFTNKDSVSRSGRALSSSRRETENALLAQNNDSFLPMDEIQSYDEFISKLSREVKPEGFVFLSSDSGLYLFFMSDEQPPQILSTIHINKVLEVTVYKKQRMLSSSTYSHIIPSQKITMLSQVTNLMAFTKNLEQQTPKMSSNELISNVNFLIDNYVEENENDRELKFLNFFKEQLLLVFKPKNQRRYSMTLLVMSYIIFATSRKAYVRLLEEEILALPSVKTLRNITLKLDSDVGLSDSQYLKMRLSKLSGYDANVLLLIDEIYLSKQVEAVGGKVFGLTDGCEIAAMINVKFSKKSYPYRSTKTLFSILSVPQRTAKTAMTL